MPKKLIVFCDGTWNSADQKTKDGRPCPTNVLRLFEATESRDRNGDPQIAHYTAGVGTKWSDRILGGGFGFGISDNIRDAYSFIISNYEPSDEIFLFGFSRGAFTARSIAGLIRNVGVLTRYKLHLLNEAYDHYRDKDDKWHPDSDLSKAFRAANAFPDTPIAFLGVWDTVGALGAPFGAVMSKITDALFKTQFHDVQLSSIVLAAYHALAIDERRWPFRPTLWELNDTHRARCAAAKAKGEITPYEEKWFAGVHSNIGGGYPDSGLADCALEWMINRASHHGLDIDASKASPPLYNPNRNAPPENSQTWYYRFATVVSVYIPAAWLKRKGDPKEAPLIDRVQWNGDYLRIVGNQGDLAAAVKAFPVLDAYTGEISHAAIEKLARDENYDPPNLEYA